MIETIQKVIQIGSSEGVTIPKKDLNKLGVKRGDSVKISVELVPGDDKHKKLLDEYDAFVNEYGQALKNLANK
jgi:antitoxin component of MazEF toxin-antitoxin module